MRLIDADALKQKLEMLGVSNAYDRPGFWYGKDKKDYKVIPTKYHAGYDNALADVEKAIQELPTIEERKTGRWIKGEYWSEGCGMGETYGYYYKCSECGAEEKGGYGKCGYNLCPKCGAKMEEGK